MKLPKTCLVIAVVIGFASTVPTQADITDFTNWSLLQLGPDPSFTGAATPTQASLSAGATGVTPGTVIAYTSIDGNTPASSTTGYFFDANTDFTIAIDYSFTFNSANGALAFGFGIGEDRTGANSAGAVFAIDNGIPLTTFLAAGVINGAAQPVEEMLP
ncbi:MAG: hypothetical protein ACR2NP_05685, partial [Pirellulaceae bacterium]